MSNSVSGESNKFLSHLFDRVAMFFPEVSSSFPAKKVVFTGNPRAQQVSGLKPKVRLKDLWLDPHKQTLCILCGSRGAPKINAAAVSACPIVAKADFQVLLSTGRSH